MAQQFCLSHCHRIFSKEQILYRYSSCSSFLVLLVGAIIFKKLKAAFAAIWRLLRPYATGTVA